MEPSIKSLLDKIKRMIETSEGKHEDCLIRYISLANLRINKHIKSKKGRGDVWSVCGASTALKHNFEIKFGHFFPKTKKYIN